ncbi:MAG: hypothetical protein JW966_05860 [Anaerolineae bacterium]|nr:hypothetical protein [Anaerolineae bacterium]
MQKRLTVFLSVFCEHTALSIQLRLTGGLLLACVLVIGGTHAFARRDIPAHVAAMLPDPDCPAPCWQGFRPGYITDDVWEQWFDSQPAGWQITPDQSSAANPDPGGAWTITLPDGRAITLTMLIMARPTQDALFVSQDSLTLGDIINALGAPAFIDFNYGLTIAGKDTLDYHVYYPRQRLIVNGFVPPGSTRLSPDTPVSTLAYEAMPWTRPVLAFDWRGFGSLTRYFPDEYMP